LTVKIRISLLLAAAVAVMLCQPAEAAKKRAGKVDLSGCIEAVQVWNLTVKQDIASFMGVSRERMPGLFCQRLAEGIRSGRITYSDMNALQLDQPTEFWKVIKGK